MSKMFSESQFNGDISKWDVSNVVDMSEMFSDFEFDGDLSNWNVQANCYLDFPIAYIIPDDFTNAPVVAKNPFHLHFLIQAAIQKYADKVDLNFIDVSQITNMSGIFCGSQFNGDISKWDVSNVVDMSEMFERSQFNRDVSQWNVSNVIDMERMFCEAQFNADISQ